MLSPQKGISSYQGTRAGSVRVHNPKGQTSMPLSPSSFNPVSPPRRVAARGETKEKIPPPRIAVPKTPPPKSLGQTKSPYASPNSPIASAVRPLSPITSSTRHKSHSVPSKTTSRKLSLQDEASLKSTVGPVSVCKEELQVRDTKKETLFSPAYKIETNSPDENQRSSLTHIQPTTTPPPIEEPQKELPEDTQMEVPQETRVQQEQFEDEFDPFLFIKNLPPLTPEMKARKAILPKRSRSTPPVCLALDLDETLVHCSIQPLEKAELTFGVNFNSQEYKVYVRMRPYLAKFLRQVSAWFEIVVFTASQKVYADKLLNILDPKRRYIKHRIFRDSCVCVDGNYLKDLTVLGRDLSKVAIVDNSVQAFGFQINNGIPIESWFDDDDDQELLNLIPFLQKLKDSKDVRPLIKKTFRLEEFVNSL